MGLVHCHSDRQRIEEADLRLEEAVTFLRKVQDSDLVLPHIKELRKIRKMLNDTRVFLMPRRVGEDH